MSLPDSPRGALDHPTLLDLARIKSSKKKSKRCVKFQLEESHDDGCPTGGDTSIILLSPEETKVKCTFGPLRAKLSKEEMQCMHYSKKEFKAFKKEAKKLARLADDDQVQALYVRTFLDVYQSAAPQAEASVNRIGVSDLVCLPLATAPVRGLERYIFPGLVSDQRLVKQSVLKAQDKIPLSIETEIRARILASASSMLSRQARHLARTMAHADSIVALSIYRRTFLPQTSSSKNKKKTAKS